jgi:hypothetical protein
MTTIAYDRPVKDLVTQLSATGHVTHTAYRKTSVTLHHNGGRLSHEGVLNVWRSRPASAHFDVDGAGAVAQYVKVNEYAWAVGNTAGNMSTISIEMANATLSPSWTVSVTTWKNSARLAGWLFAKVIGVRPSASNFFVHSHWSSTACAGPSIQAAWPQIMREAQTAYDAFKGGHVTPPVVPPVVHPPVLKAPRFPLPEGWYFGPATGPRESVSGKYSYIGSLVPWQRRMAARGWKISADGQYGPQTASIVKQFQADKGLHVDGLIGAQTWAKAWTSSIT